jgi:hypothetical protein
MVLDENRIATLQYSSTPSLQYSMNERPKSLIKTWR